MTRMRPLFLLLAAVLATVLAACGGASESNTPATEPAASFPQSITQADGEVLTIARKPERIVSLAPHGTEVFCALGAESQIVAVERYANCPLGASAKPELDGFRPNLEAIAGFRPDLVFVADNPGDIVQNLRRLGIPVLYLKVPTNLDGVLDHIRLLGAASGHAAEADRLTQSMTSRMEQVRRRLPSTVQGQRVYHELTTDYYSAAPASFVGDFYTFLKAQNIAAGAATEYPQLSAEVIVQRNPQIIVLADEAAGVTAPQVKARPGWQAIDAVKNDRICVVDPDIVSRPGPRVVDALDILAKCLYPDQFR